MTIVFNLWKVEYNGNTLFNKTEIQIAEILM